jgi:tripartite-type tricarboxylate transporter receptor subunit TctC
MGVTAAAIVPRASLADSDFYKGKTVQLVVPFSPGGFYDIAGRIVARHLPQHIDGQPNVVVQNQPGAGGLSAANRLANGTPRDGLTIATVSRSIPQLYLCGDPNVQFDPLKLTWLGSLSSYADDAYLLVVNASSPVKTIDDARRQGGEPLAFGCVFVFDPDGRRAHSSPPSSADHSARRARRS